MDYSIDLSESQRKWLLKIKHECKWLTIPQQRLISFVLKRGEYGNRAHRSLKHIRKFYILKQKQNGNTI